MLSNHGNQLSQFSAVNANNAADDGNCGFLGKSESEKRDQ
jgi:hypothetical protein